MEVATVLWKDDWGAGVVVVRTLHTELDVVAEGLAVVADFCFRPRLAVRIEDGKTELRVPLNLEISSCVYGLNVGLTVEVCLAEIICEHELPTVQEMLKNGIVGEDFPSRSGEAVVYTK